MNTDDLAAAPDGSIVFSDQLNQVVRRLTPSGTIETIAGRLHFDGNYGFAWERSLNGPVGVAWDPKGGYYVYEQFGARIRRVDEDGTMFTVAGTGEHGTGGDGGPARKAQVGMTNGPGAAALAVDSQGRVYLVDSDSSRVRRFTPGDRIVTIAGSSSRGFTGDDGPATDARLTGPSGIAIASDGRVFIADTGNNRIRYIGLDGVIRTFAGTGIRGFGGDGGPAANALIAAPSALSFDSAGNLFFLDAGNNRIRKISGNGMVSTVVGSGVPGPPVDGPAKDVPLANLRSLAVAPDATLFFSEVTNFFPNARIRYVGANQRVVSLNPATLGYRGDRIPSSQAGFASPQQITINAWGQILIADRDNHVIRELVPQPPVN